MRDTFKFATKLKEKYGVHHLYHPELKPVTMHPKHSAELFEYLRQERHRTEAWNQAHNILLERRQQQNASHFFNNPILGTPSDHWHVGQQSQEPYRVKQYKRSSSFLVQLFRRLPLHSFLFKASEITEQITLGKRWIQTMLEDGIIPNIREFDETLHSHINKTLDLLHIEPRIAWDFQIAVSTEGIIWHFDLDRAIGHDYWGRARKARTQRVLRQRVEEARSSLTLWYSALHGHIVQAIAPPQEGYAATAVGTNTSVFATRQ